MALGSLWTRLRGPQTPSSTAKLVAWNLFGFVTWLPVVAYLNMNVAEMTVVDGPSMYPFINEDKDSTLRRDVVWNYKWSPEKGLERGMVVTMRSPLHPEVVAIKRVVALEGDVVKTKQPYPVSTVTIPQGHVWVEGDGRGLSLDSNTYGPVSKSLLTGRVTHILYPFRKFGRSLTTAITMKGDDFEAEGRPPYLHSMIAGGIGGSTGDLLMHSIDTVKTRQQGDPNTPSRYTSLGQSYYTILRQEGVRRGLYGGWIPALGGSFPATVLFFGSYEWSKRLLIDHGLQQHLSYLSAGFIGDLAASIVYVPSEVLKTRLQLQGRYNNPHFKSGYNYRGTIDAARTIIRTEGAAALFHGYKATLYRDMPFSALQFMFWEQFHTWARVYKQSNDIGVPFQLLTGAAAGGLAGVLTCPLDVVKTRLQTQVHPPTDPLSKLKEVATAAQKRHISTSSPSTHRPQPGAMSLETSSIITGLRVIYRTEGIAGWFRGVGPRGVWTFIQSGCMLFLYQQLLHRLNTMMPVEHKDL
ncbi:hypothetical protein E4U55_002882 [Claviceps digitariae]|nr:hypothetical protein E4U55_002882 [Claviceps digitariae]